MSNDEILKDLQEYKNYIQALEYYKEFGDLYGDKVIIDMYERKQQENEKKRSYKRTKIND